MIYKKIPFVDRYSALKKYEKIPLAELFEEVPQVAPEVTPIVCPKPVENDSPAAIQLVDDAVDIVEVISNDEIEQCFTYDLSQDKNRQWPNTNHKGISTCQSRSHGKLAKIHQPRFTYRGMSYLFDPVSHGDQLCQLYGYKKSIPEHKLHRNFSYTGLKPAQQKVVLMNDQGVVDLIQSRDGAFVQNLYCALDEEEAE